MHLYKIIPAVILLFSFYLKASDIPLGVERSWSSAYKIDLNAEIKNDEVIKLVPEVFDVVGAVFYLDQNFLIHKDCLVYKTPSKEVSGTFKVLSTSLEKKCKDIIFNTARLEIKDIYNFALSWKEDERELSLFIDSKKYSFIFPNYIKDSNKELLDSSILKTKKPGIKISFFNSEKKGELLKEGEVCFDVNNKCEVVINKDCSLCKSGTYSVIASNCAERLRQYCGQKSCGDKGAPACVRGRKAASYNLNYCLPDSPVGFCKKPHRVFCENGELICN